MLQGPVRIIVNPISGIGVKPHFIAALAKHLRMRGFPVEVTPTRGPGHARDLARDAPDDARCVVSVGGDGTHREVVSGLLGKSVPACVVPSGTENVLARTFELTASLQQTINRIQNGRSVAVDVGLANGLPFMLFAGVGFDAAVVREVHKKRRGRINRAAYYAPIVRLLWRYEFPRLAVTVDGRPLADDAGFVLVANTPIYASQLRLAPKAVADDGVLDVVCFRTRSWREVLHCYMLARHGLHLADPLVAHGRGTRIEVSCADREVPAQVDGDAGIVTPVTCTVLPKAVRLLVP